MQEKLFSVKFFDLFLRIILLKTKNVKNIYEKIKPVFCLVKK